MHFKERSMFIVLALPVWTLTPFCSYNLSEMSSVSLQRRISVFNGNTILVILVLIC
jgi:hypothetical protein